MMPAVIFPSHIWESHTRNVLQLPIINFGVQPKWMLMLKHLDLLQEVRADAFVSEAKLRLYSMISGTPVWPGSDDVVFNTCQDLDWVRAFAVTLWFYTSPVASISDALIAFEDAFKVRRNLNVYLLSFGKK